MFEQPYPARQFSTIAPPPTTTDLGLTDADDERARAIRLLIVDDHPVVRNGIAFSLLAFSDLEVIAQASSGEEALRACAEADPAPDVIVMDLMMPGMGGIAAIQALRAAAPQSQIITLTSFYDGALVEEALRAGSIGYLLKDTSVEELSRAIRQARRGTPVLAPAAAQALAHAVSRRPPPLGQDLTEREREVLRLLAEGMTNQQIAELLVITTATVKFHTRSIRNKLGAATRTEMVVLALRNNLTTTAQ